jgi:hypothetical protein
MARNLHHYRWYLYHQRRGLVQFSPGLQVNWSAPILSIAWQEQRQPGDLNRCIKAIK